jgi:hypothetical protein
MPETTNNIELFSQKSSTFRQGNNVDIVGVAGSKPAMPTIQFPVNSGLSAALGWRFTYFPLGSLNPRTRYGRNETGRKGACNTLPTLTKPHLLGGRDG